MHMLDACKAREKSQPRKKSHHMPVRNKKPKEKQLWSFKKAATTRVTMGAELLIYSLHHDPNPS